MDRREARLRLPDARRSREAQRAIWTQSDAATPFPGNAQGRPRVRRDTSNREPERCCMEVRSLRFLLAAASFLLLAAAPASAQEGAISGRLTDSETGAPLTGARVEAVAGTRAVATAVSRSEERRVGKECRCGWSREYKRQRNNKTT